MIIVSGADSVGDNLELLIMQVYAESIKGREEAAALGLKQLDVCQQIVSEKRHELIDYLDQGLDKTGIKDQLKSQIEKLGYKKAITWLEGRLQSLVSDLQSEQSLGDRSTQRVREALKDIADTPLHFQEGVGDADLSHLFSHKSSEMLQALGAVVKTWHHERDLQKKNRLLHAQKQQSNFSSQSAALQKQLGKIKKLGFFAKVLQVVSFVALSLSAAAAPAVSAAVVKGLKITSQVAKQLVSQSVRFFVSQGSRLILKGLASLCVHPLKKSLKQAEWSEKLARSLLQNQELVSNHQNKRSQQTLSHLDDDIRNWV